MIKESQIRFPVANALAKHCHVLIHVLVLHPAHIELEPMEDQLIQRPNLTAITSKPRPAVP
jgi:hypothetical protein